MVVTAVYALIAGNGTLTKSSIVALCALGAAGGSLAMLEHGWPKAPVPIGTPVKAALLMIFAVVVMASIGYSVWPPPPSPRTGEGAMELTQFISRFTPPLSAGNP